MSKNQLDYASQFGLSFQLVANETAQGPWGSGHGNVLNVKSLPINP